MQSFKILVEYHDLSDHTYNAKLMELPRRYATWNEADRARNSGELQKFRTYIETSTEPASFVPQHNLLTKNFASGTNVNQITSMVNQTFERLKHIAPVASQGTVKDQK